MAAPLCSHRPHNVTPLSADCCLRLYLGDSVQRLSKKACAFLLHTLSPEVDNGIRDAEAREYLLCLFAQGIVGDEQVPEPQFLLGRKFSGSDEQKLDNVLAVLRSIKLLRKGKIDSASLIQTPLSYPYVPSEVFDVEKVFDYMSGHCAPSRYYYFELLSKVSLNKLRAIAFAFVTCADPEMKRAFPYKAGRQPRWWPRDIPFRGLQYLNAQSILRLIVYLLCNLYPTVRAEHFLVTIKQPGIEPEVIQQLLFMRFVQEMSNEKPSVVKYSMADPIILPCPKGIQMPTERSRIHKAIYGSFAGDDFVEGQSGRLELS